MIFRKTQTKCALYETPIISSAAGSGGWGGGLGIRQNCIISFCLCWQYYQLQILQINRFRPSPSPTVIENQSFRFGVNIFSRSTRAGAGGGGQGNFFPRGPHTLSAVLIVSSVLTFGSECWTLTQTLFRTFDTRRLRRTYGPKMIMVYGDQGLILNL